MSAVWLVLRADLRRRWRAWSVLALILGVTVGTLIAATAGARRTAGAFDEFVAEARPADLSVGVNDRQAAEAIRSTPGVARIAQVASAPNDAMLVVDGRLVERPSDATVALAETGYGDEFERFSIVEGRRSVAGAPEAVMNDAFAEQLGIEVGDPLQLVLFPRDVVEANQTSDLEAAFRADPSIADVLDLTVVGRGVRTADLVRDAASRPAYLLVDHDSAAGWLHMAPRELDDTAFASGHQVSVQIDADADPAAVLASIDPLINGDLVELSVIRSDVESATQPYVVALAAFAALAGLATIVVVGSALYRQAVADAASDRSLVAIGATTRGTSAISAARAALIGTVGTALAIALAAGLSSLFPIGPAAVAVTNRGAALDRSVVGIIGVATLLGSIAVGVVAGRRAVAPSRSPRPVPTADALRRRLPLTWATGHRLAFPVPGPGRMVLRSTLVALVTALVGAGTVTVFASSLDDLFDHPARHGWTWDFVLSCNQGYCDLPLRAADALRGTPGVEGWTFASYDTLRFDAGRVPVVATGYGRGALQAITTTDGRAPVADDEIALGANTMRELHVEIGDSVRTIGGDELTVVGRAVFTGLGQADARRPSLGDGAAMTLRGLAHVSHTSNRPASVWVAVSGDPRVAELGVQARFPFTEVYEVRRPAALAAWPNLRTVPMLLGLLLGVLGLATLAHGLATSTRLARRDLAVLHALGMSRGRLTRVVVAEAALVLLVAVVIGIPVGAGVGLVAWRAVTSRIGVESPATVSPLVSAIAIGAVVVAACCVALVPALVAHRTEPSDLRRE